MKTKEEILQERATKTAGKKTNNQIVHAQNMQVLQFSLYPEVFAIPDTYITEVFSLTEITSLPGTPPYVMGVVNRKSKVLCIINLKHVLNIKSVGLTELNKIICLKKGTTEFGIVTDTLYGITQIDSAKLNKDTLLNSNELKIIAGIMPDGMIVLNDEVLLNNKILVVE
jgi:purine-binding chemotaxis protein CheW